MTEMSKIYKQIAIEQRMYFDSFRSAEIYVKTYSDDFTHLSKLQKICGGRVTDGSYSHRQSSDLNKWGRYVWYIGGEEAYQFCLDILPYLAKYDAWRHQWCKQCIRVHEDRRHQSTVA
jgi:hypothetical protein